MWIIGDFVHFPTLGQIEIFRNHVLVIDDNGFIKVNLHASVAHKQQGRLTDEGHEVIVIPKGSFLVPTFCDLHLHAPQFMYQGTGLHLPLMNWLNEYAFKAEEKIDSDPDLALKVYDRLAQRLIENGTGAVVLFGTINEKSNLILAKSMLSAGTRAYVGKLSMDISTRPTYVEPSTEASLQAASTFADRCLSLGEKLPAHKRLIEPILTPRFVPTCSNELLKGLGELSKEKDLRIQSHMAEARDQVEWVKKERHMDDMDVFDQNGLLTPRTIQAHCTFLDSPSLSHVASRGTSIAHCPLSNAYFSAEPFKLREALNEKVRVGLGTDIAGGYSIDIMSAMRQAVATSRMREGTRVMSNSSGTQRTQLSIDWKEAMYLATTGGAKAMGLPLGVGTFRPSAPFDAQCIQISDPQVKRGIGALDFFEGGGMDDWTLKEEHVEKWWCLGDVRNRTQVWVQGRKVR